MHCQKHYSPRHKCVPSSSGSGHEYSDLDEVMKKMEHWAHRLYPKLPFDDVTDRIAVLGKKMVSSLVRMEWLVFRQLAPSLCRSRQPLLL